MRTDSLFVGIGSPHGDDQIGWRVAESLAKRQMPQVDIRQASTPSQLLDWLGSLQRLFICDACERGPTSADTSHGIERWNWPDMPSVATRSASSHSFGLLEVLRLASCLGSLPEQTTVYGIEGRSFNAFDDISPHVDQRLESMISTIASEISRRNG